MTKSKTIVLLAALIGWRAADAASMEELLRRFKTEFENSKITKSEAAGFVDVITREELEKMQARTLMDVLRLFTIPNVSRTAMGVTFLTKPTNPQMPNPAIRLYINDHDMAAGAYGSDALMWSDITLEYIDHIVVYKTSSSVEFGNEPGTVIIKLYTKQPAREEGGKIRLSADDKGSVAGAGYYAHTTPEGHAYMLFGSADRIRREDYENRGAEISSDSRSENVYGALSYGPWHLELSHNKKSVDPFLGMGRTFTPRSTDGLSDRHDYVHLTREFESDARLQLSVDLLRFDAEYEDPGGIYAGAAGFVTRRHQRFDDAVYGLMGEKIFYYGPNKLLIGGFFKRKTSDNSVRVDGEYYGYDNRLDLYSIYAEDSYSLNDTTMLVASVKTDFYRYEKGVEDADEYIARAGVIKNVGPFQIKAFYTKTYYANPMSYLYSGGKNVPYITNPKLKAPEPNLTTLGVRYRDDRNELDIRGAWIRVKDKVFYDPQKGYINLDTRRYQQYEVRYTYKIDPFNKIALDYYTGHNGDGVELSPKYGGHVTFYGSVGKFDLFGALEFRGDYEAYGVRVDKSYDLGGAIKYRFNEDFSVGIKGENLLDRGFEQAYKGLDRSIAVFDRKIWINVEYLF